MVARISDEYEPQFPVVAEDLPCPAARDVVASRVGAVRPLETINQQSRVVGNSFRLPCSDSNDSDADVLSVGAWAPENRHGMCCARLYDFDWVVPPYEPDMVLPGREMNMEIPDVDRDICVLPDEFPVVVDKTAVEPLYLPVVI